jgi:hypothetical protein
VNIHAVKGRDDEPLEDVNAHRVAEELVGVFALVGPGYLVVWEALEPGRLRCSESSSTGAKPVALRLGESECRRFGSRSRVFEEGGRKMFGDGPVSKSVFFMGSGVCQVDLFGGSKGSRTLIRFNLIVRGR